MDARECQRRAEACARKAATAPLESLTMEFLRLAAQWRAMAIRETFVGQLEVPAAKTPFGAALRPPRATG
jgi:hypothetical protein